MALPTGKNRNKYRPGSDKPYKLSRSKVQLFLDCPRCFFLDRKLGISRPKTPPFNLNLAVDELLKKEFDIYRQKRQAHPLSNGHVPYDHDQLEVWRANFQGVTFLEPETNFMLTGAIDDIWQDNEESLIIVDYKATSRNYVLDSEKHLSESNKKQADFYHYLFKSNNFKTANYAYFLYCNGLRSCQKFNAQLNFGIKLIKYQVDDSWILNTLREIKNTLEKNIPPAYNSNCDHCNFAKNSQNINQVQTLF